MENIFPWATITRVSPHWLGKSMYLCAPSSISCTKIYPVTFYLSVCIIRTAPWHNFFSYQSIICSLHFLWGWSRGARVQGFPGKSGFWGQNDYFCDSSRTEELFLVFGYQSLCTRKIMYNLVERVSGLWYQINYIWFLLVKGTGNIFIMWITACTNMPPQSLVHGERQVLMLLWICLIQANIQYYNRY